MFTEQDRNIFPYFDGAVKVFGDPLAIHARFTLACEGEPNNLLQDAEELPELKEGEMRDPEPPARTCQRIAAQQRLRLAARAALEMVAYDKATGSGATDDMVDAALWSWLEWLESKKKPSALLPTTSLPSPGSPIPAPSPTKNTADCGCK